MGGEETDFLKKILDSLQKGDDDATLVEISTHQTERPTNDMFCLCTCSSCAGVSSVVVNITVTDVKRHQN